MRVRSVLLIVLAVVAVGYVGIALKLRSNETTLLFRPNRQTMNVATADVAGLRSVPVVTTDGLPLICWFLPPQAGQATVLYLHGNGGNLTNRVSRIQRLAAHGYGLLFVEYRGFGGNPGIPSEQGFGIDALAALDFLNKAGIPDKHVVLYGESIGTSVAVTLANHRAVAGVILDSPFTSIASVAQRRYPLLPIGILIRNRFDLLDRVAKIDAPLLIIQGSADRVIPPSMGRAVFAAALQPKSFWVGTGAGHNNVLEAGGEQPVAAFIADCTKRQKMSQM